MKERKTHFEWILFVFCDSTDEESSSEAFDRRLCESKSSEHYDFSIPTSFLSDCETGYSYFGARYYDPSLLTSWTAVDPMADKYPSLSPYNYCAWNPIKLIDSDGRKIRSYDKVTRTHINSYMKDLFGKSNIFKFDKNGFLKINQRIYDRFYANASKDQKVLLDGFKSAIEAKETALVKVQENISFFEFEMLLKNGDIVYTKFDLENGGGATATTPMKTTSIYPIGINDNGERHGNMTTDAIDKEGNPMTVSATASTTFCHETLDEFLNCIVKGTTTSETPNIDKVYYQNCGQRIKGLLERNGADHEY